MMATKNAVLICFLSLFFTTIEGRCRKRPVREIIQHKNCIQKTVLNFACEGSCENSLSNILSAGSAPQACQISASRQRFVHLRCFENGDLHRLKSRNIAVSVVTECSCSTRSELTIGNPNTETYNDEARPAHATRRSRFQTFLQGLALGRHRGRHRNPSSRSQP